VRQNGTFRLRAPLSRGDNKSQCVAYHVVLVTAACDTNGFILEVSSISTLYDPDRKTVDLDRFETWTALERGLMIIL
jgi:hypothetical protein